MVWLVEKKTTDNFNKTHSKTSFTYFYNPYIIKLFQLFANKQLLYSTRYTIGWPGFFPFRLFFFFFLFSWYYVFGWVRKGF